MGCGTIGPSSTIGPGPTFGPSPLASPSVGPSLIPAGALDHERARVAELQEAGSDVYDVPDPLPAGEPGTLLKIASLIETAEGRVYRVLYHSRQADGTSDVAVSGSIWIPAGSPPADGFPIIAWGPGANGRGDACAASHRALEDSENAPLLARLVGQGYVVAATDYTGHGTRFPEVIVPETGTYSLFDAARAAIDLLGPDASNRVVAGGHSLGADNGVAALVHGPAYDDGLDIRGILALEGGTDHRRYVERVFEGSLAPWGIFGGALYYVVAYPELRIEDVLAPDKVMDVARTAEADCVNWDEIFGPQPLEAIFKLNPLEHPDWAVRIDAEAPTAAPYPIFMSIAPTSEWHVADLQDVAARLCLAAGHVEAHVYPGTDHNSSTDAALDRFLAWLADRFDGLEAKGNCGEAS